MKTTGGFQPGMSSVRAQILAEMHQPPQENENDRVLDIQSKVQMFKITTEKINKSKKRIGKDQSGGGREKSLVNNFTNPQLN